MNIEEYLWNASGLFSREFLDYWILDGLDYYVNRDYLLNASGPFSREFMDYWILDGLDYYVNRDNFLMYCML